MILQLIERYYIIYWIIFIGFAFIKIIFSTSVEGKIHGTVDIFVVLLKWYGNITRSLAESKEIQYRMRLQNLITIGMIVSLLVVAIVAFLKTYL
jgi:hypothetical protein